MPIMRVRTRAAIRFSRVDFIGALDFDFLENAHAFTTPPPADIAAVQVMLSRAEHMVLVHPLWLGTLPSRTKAFSGAFGSQ